MSVVEAVKRDLAAFTKLAPEIADSTEAATALALAAELDSDSSATSKSMCSRVLLDAMAGLREMLPEKKEADSVDELAASRAARRARVAEAKSS